MFRKLIKASDFESIFSYLDVKNVYESKLFCLILIIFLYRIFKYFLFIFSLEKLMFRKLIETSDFESIFSYLYAKNVYENKLFDYCFL